MKKYLLSAVSALVLTGGAAIASTVTVVVDFNSVNSVSGGFEQNGFTFTSSNPGGAGLASNCPTGSPNSPCLQFNNNEIITVTYVGGLFDMNGFSFNAPGNGGDLNITGGGVGEAVTETQNGNALTGITFPNSYNGISSFTFQNAGRGSGRVDNISFSVASVPVPAAGLMLMTGIGALFGRRRRKAA